MTHTEKRELAPLAKLALEMGPLVLFFLVNSYGDRWFGVAPDRRLFLATGIFVVAVLASLAVTWTLIRKLPVMPLVSAVVVTVFGGLTLILHDDLFIKLKPTIVNTLFGAVLVWAGLTGRNVLKLVLDSVFTLTDEGWRLLTWRWAFFFFVLAALNEIVWRTQTTDFWVAFKVWGIMPLTMVFAMAQMPLIMRHDASAEAGKAP
ncbi:septation protein A [Phreatobacter cathodiphilus]|uniref:Inner membrane-spanning protein YciB n=1 Tax=Phreatobacter cathodiphilus TaxID=1868589 RepID=A0A2S0NH52_9HYPH|nr:septation protein A [Phreatobacter cathodiphilus]AVO47261.1 septation protein A [Phreatobacter cathodiphilus]